MRGDVETNPQPLAQHLHRRSHRERSSAARDQAHGRRCAVRDGRRLSQCVCKSRSSVGGAREVAEGAALAVAVLDSLGAQVVQETEDRTSLSLVPRHHARRRDLRAGRAASDRCAPPQGALDDANAMHESETRKRIGTRVREKCVKSRAEMSIHPLSRTPSASCWNQTNPKVESHLRDKGVSNGLIRSAVRLQCYCVSHNPRPIVGLSTLWDRSRFARGSHASLIAIALCIVNGRTEVMANIRPQGPGVLQCSGYCSKLPGIVCRYSMMECCCQNAAGTWECVCRSPTDCTSQYNCQ